MARFDIQNEIIFSLPGATATLLMFIGITKELSSRELIIYKLISPSIADLPMTASCEPYSFNSILEVIDHGKILWNSSFDSR
jgi:hypothetical protein